jgi:uncharacterized BrkB/YihY/UPF0761 family membrane protein
MAIALKDLILLIILLLIVATIYFLFGKRAARWTFGVSSGIVVFLLLCVAVQAGMISYCKSLQNSSGWQWQEHPYCVQLLMQQYSEQTNTQGE